MVAVYAKSTAIRPLNLEIDATLVIYDNENIALQFFGNGSVEIPTVDLWFCAEKTGDNKFKFYYRFEDPETAERLKYFAACKNGKIYYKPNKKKFEDFLKSCGLDVYGFNFQFVQKTFFELLPESMKKRLYKKMSAQEDKALIERMFEKYGYGKTRKEFCKKITA